MKVCIYARVSTDTQVVHPQLLELRQYCAARGWVLPQGNEYIDRGVSGAKTSRPELNRLMKDARRRRFDAVVVYRFDRFGRSLKHLVTALDEFRGLGIGFISLHESIDTGTTTGKMLFAVIAAIAEFERDLIAERVRSGMQSAKEKLKKGPYRRRRNGKEVVVTAIGRPKKEFDVVLAQSMLDGGKAGAKVARHFGVSRSTLRSHLARHNGG